MNEGNERLCSILQQYIEMPSCPISSTDFDAEMRKWIVASAKRELAAHIAAELDLDIRREVRLVTT